jgi:hypothetical protein
MCVEPLFEVSSEALDDANILDPRLLRRVSRLCSIRNYTGRAESRVYLRRVDVKLVDVVM